MDTGNPDSASKQARNRRYVLRRRPAGDFDPHDLEYVVEPVSALGPGQALVRNRLLSLDPSNRIWMGEGESYMPPIRLGEVIRGLGIGEVIASNTAKYPKGARVLGLTGWQDYALIGPTDPYPCRVVPRLLPIPEPMMLGTLGVTGMTAFFGMVDLAKPRPGETVIVSAAAGAVGSVAGQIAKIRGARVVGIAGSREKCALLTTELGFDAAVCRRDPDWRQQLIAACPNGVDVDFENAGGEIMEAVFGLLNHHARVVLCGLVAQYGADGSVRGPGNFTNLLMRRVSLKGFNVLDYSSKYEWAAMRLGLWILQGRIKDRHTMIHGLDLAPKALVGMFKGENIGKLIVQVAERC